MGGCYMSGCDFFHDTFFETLNKGHFLFPSKRPELYWAIATLTVEHLEMEIQLVLVAQQHCNSSVLTLPEVTFSSILAENAMLSHFGSYFTRYDFIGVCIESL